MSSVPVDAQSAVDELTQAGFTPEQARANVKFVRSALEGGVATRADIGEVRHDMELLNGRMDGLSKELRGEMETLSKELRGEMESLANELRGEMAALRQELRGEMEKLQLRMTVLILGTSGALGVFLKFF
jgi:chromosome segregation ATPase